MGEEREIGRVEFGTAAKERNRALDDLVGNMVEVRTNGADNHHLDKGVLLDFDDPWVKIENNGEILCFPVHNIRLVKLVKRLTPQQSADLLLRPTEKMPDE